VNDVLKRATNAERHVDLNLRPGSLQELRNDERSRDMVMSVLPSVDYLYCTSHELCALSREFDVKNPWKKNLPEKFLTKWAQDLCDEYGINKVVIKDAGFGVFMQIRHDKTIFVSALHLGGKNTIGLGDRLRDGIVIQSYLGLGDLEGLVLGSTLSALQSLEHSYPENLTEKSFRETALNNRNYYLVNGIDLDSFIQKISI
jgi:sugar/nucleoside kinase (ribokinase family)